MKDFKKFKNTIYQIIGAAMTVHREMDYGLAEEVYNECLCLELDNLGISNVSEQKLPVFYKNKVLNKHYRMDIVVGDIIIELKSVKEIIPAHRAQLFNYLRISKKPVGILINFGEPKLKGERYAYIEESNQCVLLDKDMELLFENDVDWEFEDNNTKIYE